MVKWISKAGADYGAGFRNCLMVLLIALSATSHSGHYEATYSGGQVEWYGANDSGISSYSGGNGLPWGGNRAVQAIPQPATPAVAYVKCTGEITVEFVWIPDPNIPGDLPPSEVILYEYSAASWQGTSGACDNGIGSLIGTVPGPNGTPIAGSSSGYRYTVLPGKTELTHTVSPTATGYCAPVTFLQTIKGCGASVLYAATILIPDIVEAGAVDFDGEWQALVGAGLNFQVECSGPDPFNLGGVMFAYAAAGWESTHQFVEGYGPGLGPGSQRLNLFDLAGVDNPSFFAYAGFKGTGTITAHMSFYGTNGQSADISVTKPLNIVVPISNPSAFNGSENGILGHTLDSAAVPHHSTKPFAMNFFNQLTFSSPYSAFGSGTAKFVQTLDGEEQWYHRLNETPTKNTIEGLDLGDPYPLPVSPNEIPVIGSPPTTIYTNDSPDITGAPLLDYKMEKFATFKMLSCFRPPAVDGMPTIYVPVIAYDWTWGGVADAPTYFGWITAPGVRAGLAGIRESDPTEYQWSKTTP